MGDETRRVKGGREGGGLKLWTGAWDGRNRDGAFGRGSPEASG